jgi:hypothetical protein
MGGSVCAVEEPLTLLAVRAGVLGPRRDFGFLGDIFDHRVSQGADARERYFYYIARL